MSNERRYTHSSEFPPEARDRIPSELLTAVDKGNEDFFAEFAVGQPRTYEVLTKRCDRVSLVESRWIDQWSGGVEKKSFWWGLHSTGRSVIGNIPLPSRIAARIENIYLACLPKELRCYYHKMDGMSVPKKQGPGIRDWDLPHNLSGWLDLEDYRKVRHWRKTVLDKFRRDFGHTDLRIVVWGTQKDPGADSEGISDIVFVDFRAKDRKMYHVKNGNFDDYRLIENAPTVLDRYFANAILGFPERFDFRDPAA